MKKNYLTPSQRTIASQAKHDTEQADEWMRSQGVSAQIIAHTDGSLIKAQQIAHDLLTNHIGLLSDRQVGTLRQFQRKMATGHIRRKLKPTAADAVFMIGTKVRRILHRQAQSN